MRYNDEDGFEDEDVFEADTGRLEGAYKGVLGASTAQQVIRKNSEAWRGFFRLIVITATSFIEGVERRRARGLP